MTPIDLDDIARKAAAATPGPWAFDPEQYEGVLSTFREIVNGNVIEGWARPICHPGCDDEGNELPFNDDAAFIAACSPEVVRSLCLALRDAVEGVVAGHIEVGDERTEDTIAREYLAKFGITDSASPGSGGGNG